MAVLWRRRSLRAVLVGWIWEERGYAGTLRMAEWEWGVGRCVGF